MVPGGQKLWAGVWEESVLLNYGNTKIKGKISYILFQGNNPCFSYMFLFKLADASGAI